MPAAIRVSDNLLKKAKVTAKAMNRSMAGQIEFWAKIGQIAEENPDLPYALIHDILISLEEFRAGQAESFDLETEL